jgi:hypothetical protein
LDTLNALNEQERYVEAFEFAVSTDAFTAEKYAQLTDLTGDVSAEDRLRIYNELRTRATEIDAGIPPEVEADLDSASSFFETGIQCSDVMVESILDLVSAHPEAPVGMIIGAGHTARVVKLLAEAGASFAVLRSQAQAETSSAGLLSYEAFNWKLQGLSAAPEGWLGAVLEDRRKPPPVANRPCFQIEVEIRLVAQGLAHKAECLADRMEYEATLERRSAERTGEMFPEPLAPWSENLSAVSRYKVLGVEPPQEDNPNPTVLFRIKFENPTTGEIQAIEGFARRLEGERKPPATLAHRLSQVREELRADEGTEGPVASQPQQVCSDTEAGRWQLID